MDTRAATQKRRSSRTHVLGIDIAKITLATCLINATDPELPPIDAVGTVENRKRGYRAILRQLQRHKVSRDLVSVVMEATGVYWEKCAEFFHRQGYAVYVVNPARTGRFREAYQQSGKSDIIDAEAIARYGVSMPMRSWEPPQPECHELREILRLRDESVGMVTQMKNRRHAVKHQAHPCQVVISSLSRQIAFQEKEVKRLTT